MSELFLSYLLYCIAALVMFLLALKFCYKRLSGNGIKCKNSVGIRKRMDNSEYKVEPDEEMENVSRIANCLNCIIWVGVILFALLAISYFFHLFESIPVNPAKW